MARAGILYSHVTTAATQLVAAGKNPTVDSVREQLGGTGSKSTIAPLLKQWKAQHHGDVAAAGAGVPLELLEAVKGVYERMQADAQQQVELARTEHQAAQDAVLEQLSQCQVHEGMVSQAAAALSVELAQTKEVLAHLQGTYQAEQITVATLRSDNDGMERCLSDRAAEVKALVEQLAQGHAQFEHYQVAIGAQRLEDRQAYERQVGRLEKDLASAQQRLLTQQTTLAQHDTQLVHLRGEHAVLLCHTRSAREELITVSADRVQLTRQLAEATTSAKIVTGKYETAAEAVIELRIALAAKHGQMELMADELASVRAERDELVQDKGALAQRNTKLVGPLG